MSENFVYENGHLMRNDDGTWEGMCRIIPESRQQSSTVGIGIVLSALAFFSPLWIVGLIIGVPIAIWLLVVLLKANAPLTFKISSTVFEIRTNDVSETHRIPIGNIAEIRLNALGMGGHGEAGYSFAVIDKSSAELFARNIVIAPEHAPHLVSALHQALGIGEVPAVDDIAPYSCPGCGAQGGVDILDPIESVRCVSCRALLNLARTAEGGIESVVLMEEDNPDTVVASPSPTGSRSWFDHLCELGNKVYSLFFGLIFFGMGGAVAYQGIFGKEGTIFLFILLGLIFMAVGAFVVYQVISRKQPAASAAHRPAAEASKFRFVGVKAWLITAGVLGGGSVMLFFSLNARGNHIEMIIALGLLLTGAFGVHHLLFYGDQKTETFAAKLGPVTYAGVNDLRAPFAMILFSFLILYITVLAPFIGKVRTSNWVSVPCQIVASEVRSDNDDDESETYELIIAYAYSYQGESFKSWQYDFSTHVSGFSKSYEKIVAQLPIHTETNCFVNPARPAEAVLNPRSLGQGGNVLLGGATALLLGGMGICTGLVTVRHRIREQGSSVILVPTAIVVGTFALFAGTLWLKGYPIHVPATQQDLATEPQVEPISGTQSDLIDELPRLTDSYLSKHGYGWTLRDGTLQSPEGKSSVVALPGKHGAADFRFAFTVRRSEPKESLAVFLPMGGRIGAFYIDGYPNSGFKSVLAHHNKPDVELPPSLSGLLVKDTEAHRFEFIFRGDTSTGELRVNLDGKEVYKWHGDLSVLRLNPGYKAMPLGQFGFASHFPEWRISDIRIVP